MKKSTLVFPLILLSASVFAQQIKTSPAYDNIHHEQELKRRNSPPRMHPDSSRTNSIPKPRLQGPQNKTILYTPTITPVKTNTPGITPLKKK